MDIFSLIIAKMVPIFWAGIICIILQKLTPSIKGQKILTKDSRIDVQYLIAASFIFTYLYTIFTNIVFALAFKVIDRDLSEAEYLYAFPFEVKVIFALIIFDFVGYWWHRFYHMSKLWRIHAIHHSSEEIDWLTSARFHPIDRMLIIASQFFVAVLIFGFTPEVVVVGAVMRSTYGLIVHSNLNWTYGKLGYVIASPVFHRWHHTQEKEGQDKNFSGVFSLWDYMFGTAYKNSHEQPHTFGIREDIGNNIFTQLASPFLVKKLKRQPSKR